MDKKKSRFILSILTILLVLVMSLLVYLKYANIEKGDGSNGIQYVEYHFRSEKYLVNHYKKHGIEMGFSSPEEYEEGASNLINNPDCLYRTEKEDGDGIYYLEATNEFAILSFDGYIRTYFKPDDGIEYFYRQ